MNVLTLSQPDRRLPWPVVQTGSWVRNRLMNAAGSSFCWACSTSATSWTIASTSARYASAVPKTWMLIAFSSWSSYR